MSWKALLAYKIYSQIVRASGRGHARYNYRTLKLRIILFLLYERIASRTLFSALLLLRKRSLAPGKLTRLQHIM